MIALVTGGTRPEHVRFAYRAQVELGERVTGWWQVTPANGHATAAAGPADGGLMAKLRAVWTLGGALGVLARVPETGRKVVRRGSERLARRSRAARVARAEKQLFSAEIAALSPRVRWHEPDRGTISSDVRVAIALDAEPVIAGARVFTSRASALAGLYHRRLDWVVAEVRHEGRVVREAWPTLEPSDSPEACRLRVAALAGEMLIEAAREALATGTVGERLLGQTRPTAALPADAAARIERDFASGWLRSELQRTRHY